MKLAVFLLTFALASIAQPNAVLNDLQERVSARVPLTQQNLRARLERSLGLDRVNIPDDVGAQLYLPPSGNARMPAVVVVEPHSDKSGMAQEILPATLSRLGFLTIVLDAFPDHSRFDRLVAGVTPETLMQTRIRSALSYLLSRPDVDPKRIGLIADTFVGIIAADLNPELSAIVLTRGIPNLKEELAAMRDLGSVDLPDSCLIVPGLLNYADSTTMLMAIAPRPLLVFESRPPVLAEVREAYASRSAGGLLRERSETYGSPEWRLEIYRWLRTHLMNDSSFEVLEATGPANVVNGRLPPPPPVQRRDVQPSQVSQALLDGLLGEQLPVAKISLVLTISPSQRVVVTTQPGIDIPMTVLRPGPGGGGYHSGIVVAFADEGRASLTDDPFLAEAVRRNWMVWLVDPRGLGEWKSASDAFVFAASTLLGENFAWRQAADVARIAQFATTASTTHRVGVYAKGKLASLVAGYAVTIAGSERAEWLVSRDAPLTVDDLSQLPLYAVPFATQDVFDFRDLFLAMPSNALSFGESPADFHWR